MRLINASDEERSAAIGSGRFGIVDAWACDLSERRSEQMSVDGSRTSLTVPPRGLAVIALDGGMGNEV